MDEINKIEAIATRTNLSLSQCIEIAYHTVRGNITSPEDIATIYHIPLEAALILITNSAFSVLIHNISIAYQKYRFDAIALRKMLDIVEFSADDKNKIAATKVTADILGINKAKEKTPVHIEFNFDSLVRDLSKEKVYPGL